LSLASCGRLRVGADGAIESLLIARRGKLVAEEYYQGRAAETVHTMQSVSKSVASLLTGIVSVFTGRQSANEMRAIDLFYTYILAAAR